MLEYSPDSIPIIWGIVSMVTAKLSIVDIRDNKYMVQALSEYFVVVQYKPISTISIRINFLRS